jgi:O-antigen ligase
VNLSFAAAYQNPEPLRHSAYYLQVLLGCIAFAYVLRTEPAAPRLLTLAILGSLGVQLVTLAVTVPAHGVRATLLFSNPNQLGFFGLLALAFILLLNRYTGYRASVAAFGATAAILMVLISLSKGAILAAAILLYLYLLLAPMRDLRWRRLRPLFLVLFPVALIAIAVAFRDQIAFLAEVGDRLSQIGEQGDDSLAGRGYVRIFEWPQYLFFGAGEGLLARWEYPREIHSMFGTLIFSYGLPGLGIVCALLAVAWRRNARDFAIYLVPAMLYALVHHPMRQTMFWALVIAIAHFGPVAGLRAPRQS